MKRRLAIVATSNAEVALGSFVFPEHHDRPQTRAECRDGPRPCPFVGCRHHLAEIWRNRGQVLEWTPPEGAPTCSLDLADQGGMRQAEVAEAMGITRAAVSLVEIRALAKARAYAEAQGFDLAALLPPPEPQGHWATKRRTRAQELREQARCASVNDAAGWASEGSTPSGSTGTCERPTRWVGYPKR